MASINNIKRIRAEDFPEDSRDFANKLALILNPMLDQLLIVFNKGIDFKNLNMQIASLSVSVDSSGIPKQPTSIKSTLKTSCVGLVCVRALNASGTNGDTTATPFIAFTENSGVFTINSIKGLVADNSYNLTVLCLGSDI